MRTVIRVPARHPVRLGRRPANSLVVLGILGLVTALATWQGTPPSIVVPVAVTAGLVAVFLDARRSLRVAAKRIDSILREELGPETESDRELAKYSSIPAQDRSAVEERLQLERRQGMVDDHRGGADDACPVARTGLDDAQLRGGQRQ
jgi:hypothetical protein